MPIAKSAQPIPTAEPISQPTTNAVSVNTMVWEGVPVDIYRYFSLDLSTTPEKEITKVREIYDWARFNLDEPTIGNVMEKMSKLQSRFGASNIGEKVYDKMWRWVKMDKHQKDLEQRKQALERSVWL